MSIQDKTGGAQYPNWLREGFNEAIQDAGLRDMELVGHQYTWERGRDTVEWMEIRLDRALTIDDWLTTFHMAKLYNLEGSTSDHSAIFLATQTKSQRSGKFHFKFENAWLAEPMCEQLVKDGWEGDASLNIQQKVQACSENLAVWGREVTGNSVGVLRSAKSC